MASQGLDSRERVRPLRAGCSFGLLHRVGTLGLVVRDETGQRRLLSSSHVLNRVPDGRRYDLYQPAGRDRRGTEGPVARAFRFTVLDPRVPNRTEAGLAEPLVPVDDSHPICGTTRGVCARPRVGMRLWKIGRTTGVVAGVLEVLDWSGRIRFHGRRYPFAGQFVVRSADGASISLDGDSGSVWIDEHGDAVALNFAGADAGRSSIASPMALVLERMRARIGG